MYEVAICDDEQQDREFLKAEINRSGKYVGMLRFHEYKSGAELLKDMKKIEFSIIFMDIQMEGMDGEETAQEIRKWDDSVILVFWTGYAEPGVHSFEMQPYRFIKKNMPDEERWKYIEDSLERMITVVKMPYIQAKCGSEKLFLRPDDVIYMEKSKKYIQVHLSEQAKIRYDIAEAKQDDIRIYDKMDNIYKMLKPYGYGCPHSSYVINFKYLISSRQNTITLEGFINLNVTRSKALEFNQMKKSYMTMKYEDGGRR